MYILRASDNGRCYAYPADSRRVRALRLQEDALYTLARPHVYLKRA